MEKQLITGSLPMPLVEILESAVDYTFDQQFRVMRARLRYRRFDGAMSGPVTRISFERGDSVGVLLYDPQGEVVVLVRQFRYPVYAGMPPEEQGGNGVEKAWIIETVAGMQDQGLAVTAVANKELLEEAGFVVSGQLNPIATFYVSPGGTSERIYLFWGEVDARHKAGTGGGVAAEGEDTQIIVLPLREALDMIASGEISDAKTIIALQYLYINQLQRSHQAQ